MTNEKKSIIEQELCARLPYKVKCYVPNENIPLELTGKRLNYFCFHNANLGLDYRNEIEVVLDPLNSDNVIKPYLRSLSSMTKEELKEFWKLNYRNVESDDYLLADPDCLLFFSIKLIDWLNKNHFDYRKLIPQGLAIKVTEENNPYKQ